MNDRPRHAAAGIVRALRESSDCGGVWRLRLSARRSTGMFSALPTWRAMSADWL